MPESISLEPLDELTAILADDLAAVDRVIRVRTESRSAPRVGDVATHIVGAGGKRIRPMFTLASARHCGYRGTEHFGLAATVELIHTATLLHDDVVDQSQSRRGRTTANLLWDNKSSILVGDYLFARSFQLMVESGSIRILAILANAAATIAEGEVLQLTACRSLATDEYIYRQVIHGKTAVLFAAAAEVGAVVAGADQDFVDSFRDFGTAYGMCFQITDDILDYSGDSQTLRKNKGDDFRECKLTLPVIKAARVGTEREREFWKRTIEDGNQRDGDFEEALCIINRRQALDSSREDALEWSEKAKTALSRIPESPRGYRELLLSLADRTVSRLF